MATKNILYINSIQSDLSRALSYTARDFETNQSITSFEENLKNNLVSKISN